jgi:hypothetical protein
MDEDRAACQLLNAKVTRPPWKMYDIQNEADETNRTDETMN